MGTGTASDCAISKRGAMDRVNILPWCLTGMKVAMVQRVNINGAALEYEISGTGEPVLFIHGAFIADTFRLLLTEPALESRYQLILYHRRGYAGSDPLSGPIS